MQSKDITSVEAHWWNFILNSECTVWALGLVQQAAGARRGGILPPVRLILHPFSNFFELPFAMKTLPTRKNYFRIIFRLPFHDFDFFELILENYPIPIAFV